jgi:hypothetical protein
MDVRSRMKQEKIERETDKAVWIDGRKCVKGKWAGDVYDTWQEAKKELVDRINTRIEGYQKRLHEEYEFLSKVKSLMPPRTAAHKSANCI